jgi:hypothetical protein
MKSILLAVVLLLAACNYGGAEQSVVRAASNSGWTISYSPGMPPHLEGSEGRYYFDFPPTDGVHYVTSAAPAVRLNQTITMHFAVAGDGRLVATEGSAPARVRLFLQQRGDRSTASEPFKRWWSVAYVDLNGHREFTLTARLVPSQWSSVFGKNGSTAPNEFKNCLAALGKIGFTFGGAFAGHGVYVTRGKARFILQSFTITSKPSSSRRSRS